MPRFHELAVKSITRETADCVSVAFDLPDFLRDNYAFKQGQYLTLRTTINGEDVRRSYSICASPFDQELRVAIKKVPGGRFSTFANEELQVGDRLQVMTPMGKFYTELNANHDKEYVAFAAGSGITPILSIMKAVLHAEPKSIFTLFYGNRRTDTIIFRDTLEDLKNRFLGRLRIYHILSREDTGSDLFFGRIDAEKAQGFCQKLIDPEEVDEYFLCGPLPMIETIKSTLLERQVPEERIHLELFTTAGEGRKPKTTRKKSTDQPKEIQTEVEVLLDGNRILFPIRDSETTILDGAAAAGADLPFSCKGGVCSTCRAKVVEGEVEMDINYALEPDEVEAGFVLTCRSYPKTAQVKIDFDA